MTCTLKNNIINNKERSSGSDNCILWYALYTAPRAEKRVEARLKEMGVECFLPTLMLERKWSDRIKVVEQPLFSSYIFVRTNANHLLQLNKVYGVVRVVFYCGAPAVIRECEIEAVRKFISLSGERCTLVSGDMVEVVCGPLSKGSSAVTGKILSVRKDFLSIYVEKLGVRVTVRRSQVKKKNEEENIA